MERCRVCDRVEMRKTGLFPVSTYDKAAYQLLQCPDCQVRFLLPFPEKDTLEDIYRNRYFYASHDIISGEKKYRTEKIARYVQKMKDVKRVLDVGCMHGFLVECLEKAGFDCSGIEMDKESAECCLKKGLRVKEMSLEELFREPERETYDLIILSHVLEHLEDAKGSLELLQERLSDGGRILVIVPNADSFMAKLFGKYWGYWDVPVHIWHFNLHSLSFMAESVGMKVADRKKVGGSSLMFFSTFVKMFHLESRNLPLGPWKKKILRAASGMMKYWYVVGDDELMMVLEKRDKESIRR